MCPCVWSCTNFLHSARSTLYAPFQLLGVVVVVGEGGAARGAGVGDPQLLDHHFNRAVPKRRWKQHHIAQLAHGAANNPHQYWQVTLHKGWQYNQRPVPCLLCVTC